MERDSNMEEYFKNFLDVASGKNMMVHLDDLVKNRAYRINQFRFVDTKNGKCVAVDFEDGTWTFLPQRLASIIKNDQHIEVLTSKCLSLFFLGRDEKRMNMALLDFRTIPVATFNVTDMGDPKELLSEILFGEILEGTEGQKPKTKKVKR